MSVYRYPKPTTFPDLGTKHWVMEASAGTGKTYTLEHLVVDLVLDGNLPLEQIVIVTYTEAASLELRRRIREKLEELRNLGTDKFKSGSSHWDVDDAARLKLDAALQSFDRTVISTIHAFCQKILQDSAFETGRHFRQERVDEKELFAEVFKDHLRTKFCATEDDQAFLVRALAEAGSPETLLKILREAWGARATLLPSEADQTRERVAVQAFPLDDLDRTENLASAFGTKAWGTIQGRFTLLATRLQALRDQETPEAWALLRAMDVFEGASTGVWAKTLWETPLSIGPASRIRAGLQAIQAARPTTESLLVHRLLPPLAAEIEQRKAAEGLYDFNDMIGQVAEGLQNPGLVARLQDRYKAALIDEFQDTDARQWDIFKALFAGPEHRLILVGDPKQAIYDFRGGDLPTYLKAREQLLQADGKRLALAQNFRSSESLIQAVNQLLEPEGAFFTKPNEYPDPVTAGRATSLEGSEGPLPPITLLKVQGSGRVGSIRNRLAAGIATVFRNLLDGGAVLHTGTDDAPRPLHAGDLMVLTYTTRESKLIAKALRAAGLPSMFFKADGLFQTREALELQDLLSAVLRPDDPDARGRALLTRFFGFGLAEAEACLDLSSDHPILARLERWQELARQRRYPRLFNTLLEESGVVPRLLLTEQGDRALTNLRHIIEHLLAEATAFHPDLEDLLLRLGRWIREEDLPAETEDPGTQRAEGQAKAVRILTIHKAKGLEAPVVALFGGYSPRQAKPGDGQRFHDAQGERCLFLGPLGSMQGEHKRRAADEAQQEEERKLYVAITRPKVRLVLPVFEQGTEKPNSKGSFDELGHPKGAYGLLNRRLRSLLESCPAVWSPFAIPLPGATPALPEGQLPAPPSHLEPMPEQARPDFTTLARRGRPLWIYSFTSLSKAFGEASRPSQREDEGRTDEVETIRITRPLGGLPPGTASGLALHELLERIPQGQIATQTAAAWREALLPLAQESLEHQGLNPALAADALQMARLALATPVPLPTGSSVVLDQVTRRLAEVGFQMPFPGHSDALEGFMDLLFEWEDRIYVLDWKSNTLDNGDYGEAALDQAMASHYDLQVRIYTLVALALAGIADEAAFEARYGGAIYVFLRGLPTGGLWARRPTWAEVQTWQAELSALPIDELAMSRMERGMHG